MPTQENQPIAIDTPLGKDVLLLQGFSGREAISSLFSFNLVMESENDSLDFGGIIGKSVTIRLALDPDKVGYFGDKDRYWNGIVSRFTQTGHDAGYTHYQMEVVPWLWLLTRNINSRIFQGRSIPEILKVVFDRGGFTQTDYRFVFSGTDYDPLEYCVQYRESDFNFVSRLLEQYGFFYYFEHQQDKHVLVILDSSTMLETCFGQETARYDASWGGLRSEGVVTSWQMDQELRTGTCSVNDYNFQQPNQNLCLSESTIMEVGGNSRFEHYEHPAGGTALQRVDMKIMAGLRMQEVEAGHIVCSGTSSCRAFAPGYTFELKEFPRDDMNASYLLREIQHSASARGSYGSGDDGGGFEYSNRFVCIPASIPFRAARVTPKPLIHGSQTALVTGPEGEEICVDEFGRVKVQFYWDREGGNVEFSWDHENGNHHLPTSCWIRVSQLWAGKGWGSMWIPRIGQEVVVSFLEGDPDRPSSLVAFTTPIR